MKRDADLLYELGALRHIQRQWTRFHLANVGDLADHHFRVAWIALMIAQREAQPVDTAKILKMALVHDVAESRTNDVDYLARQYVERREDQAAADIFAETSLEDDMLAVLGEYIARESLEAKIVKDADNLDVDIELREQESTGHTLPSLWYEHRQLLANTKLYTESAKMLYQEIRNTNPHNWHINAPRNRILGGDWKDALSSLGDKE